MYKALQIKNSFKAETPSWLTLTREIQFIATLVSLITQNRAYLVTLSGYAEVETATLYEMHCTVLIY